MPGAKCYSLILHIIKQTTPTDKLGVSVSQQSQGVCVWLAGETRRKFRETRNYENENFRDHPTCHGGGDIPDWQTRQCLNKDDISNPPNMV